MMSAEIVKMAECHVKDIAEIEKLCFSTPWSEGGLREELSNDNARFFVALSGGNVAGYIGSHNIVGEVYITNIAVNPSFRRQGIGEALVSYLVEISKGEGADFVTLEVRESNEPAQKLYNKKGFCVEKKKKSFYENPREDAILMTIDLKD